MQIKKIIDELKKIPRDIYYTFFRIGTTVDVLKPNGDLDLFFIIKGSRKNDFFMHALKILDTLKKEDKYLNYSLFRGPTKYKGKKLIHFLVYTKKQFLDMRQPVIKSCLEKGKVISGVSLKKLLRNFKFDRIGTDQKEMEEKWAKTLKEGKARHTEWIRSGNSWKVVHKTIKLDNFQMRHWRKYVSKFKSNS